MQRRTFVKGVFALGATAVASTQINAKSNRGKKVSNSNILTGKIFNLVIDYKKINITGNNSVATVVNNNLPAPTLVWREGDIVTINVTNNLKVDTSLHWHGIILPYQMDGVPGVSFKGIKPGETFTYRFRVKQSGTYWYHSHSGYQEQTGVHGTIVILPKRKEPFRYDRDYVVMLTDWSDEKPTTIYKKLKKSSGYYNVSEQTVGDFVAEVKSKGLSKALSDRSMWSKMRMSQRDLSDVTGYTYTYLMNGANPSTQFRAIFKKGEKIRLRFVNGSAMTFFDVRIPGLKIRVIAADGNYVKPVSVDEFRIGVAESYDVIVEPTKDIPYSIFAQAIDRSGYALGSLTPDANIVAKAPKMDSIPTLNMSDMGMDMSSMMAMDKANNKSSMNNMKMMKKNMHKMGMKMDMKRYKFSAMDKQKYPQTKLPMRRGIQTTMMAMNPKYRLDDPGVGLRDNGRKVLTYYDLKNLYSTKHAPKPDREIVLHLTGNMERYMWSINGIKFSQSEPLKFKYGERLRITLINDTMMNHPMHLHGMWSDLETGDDNHLVRKHTVIVQPGSKISYRVTVDAKGYWVYHCHLLYHMAGMFRNVIVS